MEKRVWQGDLLIGSRDHADFDIAVRPGCSRAGRILLKAPQDGPPAHRARIPGRRLRAESRVALL